MRFYLDSNVFQYIKPEHPSYNKELHAVMDSLASEVLFIFSCAHLEDLKNCTKEQRESDLELMSRYVRDNYFYRNPIKNVTTCLIASPIQAADNIDYSTMNNVMNNPLDLDLLTDNDDGAHEGMLVNNLINSVFSLPISAVGPTIDTSNFTEGHRILFDKVFPNYKPEMSVKEFLNSVMCYGSALLNDPKEVTELRKHAEDYIKSDTYSFRVWGMEFNEKLREKTGKSFLDMIEGMLLEKQKNDFYIRFQHAYALLEMFNITREKAGKKTKRFNYWSLNNDASHAYFASLCDYLVTDDKGMQVKATILYKLFGIETKVLSTKDFVEEAPRFISHEKTASDLIANLNYNIENSGLVSAESEIETRDVISWYKMNRTIVALFSDLYVIQHANNINLTYVLSFGRSLNDCSITLMHREIELVVSKVVAILGKDDLGREQFSSDEKFSNGDPLRLWSFKEASFELLFQVQSGALFVDLRIHTEC